MGTSRPRRAAEETPQRALFSVVAAVRRSVVDVVLWTLGALGLASVLAAVAAHIWGFSIILFSTGSMSPTIPAGSAALVRLLPADQLRVGDVTTVERPGQLPITHRITSIQPLAGSSEARVVTMRGDANALEDPQPYVITDARLVVASMPGVASWFANLRDARLMALLTLIAGGLVTWALWPRQARRATVVVAAALAASSSLTGSTEAQAAETERHVVGEHLVLTVISDEDAMASMVPGVPVLWQVGVNTAGQEEGAVHVGVGLEAGSVAADLLTVDVLSCTERWQGETCPGAAEAWVLDTALDQAFLPSTHGDTRELTATSAGDPVWVQVRATLARHEQNVKATLKVDAWGAGEVVSAESDGGGGTGPGNGLASTGADGIPQTLALAGAAIGTGLVVARLAGGRRRDADREVAR